MFARLVAFVCIIHYGLCSHLPEPVGPPLHPVVVLLKGAERQSPGVLALTRRELTQLMRPAGYAVEVRTKLTTTVEVPLVVIEFQGDCSAQAPSSASDPSTDLATTSVVKGKVQPFTKLHCSAIRRTLAAALQPMMPGMQDSVLGRSIGRILAHELYHILANETRHSERGIAKSQFSASDLMASRVSFDQVALTRMSQDPPPAILAGGEE